MADAFVGPHHLSKPTILPAILNNNRILWKLNDKEMAEYLVHPYVRLGILLWYKEEKVVEKFVPVVRPVYNIFILEGVAYAVERVYASDPFAYTDDGEYDSDAINLHKLVRTKTVVKVDERDKRRADQAMAHWLERML